MGKVINHKTLCVEYNTLNSKAHKALIEKLNKRGVENINVKTYMDNDFIDCFCFPQTDKNGYGVNVKIDTIRKDENGEWVADVVDVDYAYCGELELTTWNFDASALIDILGIVEGIFDVADKYYNGKVYSAGEEIEDDED